MGHWKRRTIVGGVSAMVLILVVTSVVFAISGDRDTSGSASGSAFPFTADELWALHGEWTGQEVDQSQNTGEGCPVLADDDLRSAANAAGVPPDGAIQFSFDGPEADADDFFGKIKCTLRLSTLNDRGGFERVLTLGIDFPPTPEECRRLHDSGVIDDWMASSAEEGFEEIQSGLYYFEGTRSEFNGYGMQSHGGLSRIWLDDCVSIGVSVGEDIGEWEEVVFGPDEHLRTYQVVVDALAPQPPPAR